MPKDDLERLNEQYGTEPAPEAPAPEDAKSSENGSYLYDDATALRIALADFDAADSFLTLNSWPSKWIDADELYQNPTASMALGGTNSKIPKFTLSNAIDAIVPQQMNAVFHQEVPFQLNPRGSTSPEIVRAKTALYAKQLDDMQFKVEAEDGFFSADLLGTAVFKWGCGTTCEYVLKCEPKAQPIEIDDGLGNKVLVHTEESDDYTCEWEEKKVWRPWIKSVDRRYVRTDPGCRRGDIRTATKVFFTDFLTYEQLQELRDQGYDIPPDDDLKKFYEEASKSANDPDNISVTMPEMMRGWLIHAMPRGIPMSEDPLQNTLALTEEWTDKTVVAFLSVGNVHVIVRNEENPWGKKPFLSYNYRNIKDAFEGQGLGMLIGAEQLVEMGITNLSLGLLAYGLHPQIVRKRGFNTTTQDIVWKQGGFIDVDDDVRQSMMVLDSIKPPAEAWVALQQSKASAEETSGANAITSLGGTSAPGRGTGLRNATAASLVGAAKAGRLAGPIGRFINQVFVPWLYIMDELNSLYMPTSQLRDSLSETEAKDIEIDQKQFREGRCKFEAIIGANVEQMLQVIPVIESMVNNPVLMESAAEAGLTFNFTGFWKSFRQSAGIRWADDIFVKADPQALAQRQANSPAGVAAAKAQQQSAIENQKFQQQMKLVDEKGLARAAERSQTLQLEHALNSGQDLNQPLGEPEEEE